MTSPRRCAARGRLWSTGRLRGREPQKERRVADRNELFRRQRERHQQDGQLARALQQGDPRATPRDRFGVPIRPGQHLLFRPTYDFVYEVLAAEPVLDPSAPPGMVRLRVRTESSLVIPAGSPLMNMIVLGTVNPEAPVEESAREPEKEVPADFPAEAPGPKLVVTDAE